MLLICLYNVHKTNLVIDTHTQVWLYRTVSEIWSKNIGDMVHNTVDMVPDSQTTWKHRIITLQQQLWFDFWFHTCLPYETTRRSNYKWSINLAHYKSIYNLIVTILSGKNVTTVYEPFLTLACQWLQTVLSNYQNNVEHVVTVRCHYSRARCNLISSSTANNTCMS